MADIIQFPQPTKDGGKERILAARARREAAGQASPDSLVMDHADPELPCDSEQPTSA